MLLNPKKKTKLIAVALYGAFTLSLIGSVCGTFAWYTYGARAAILYEGSSLGGSSTDVYVGLVGYDYLDDDECEASGLTREEGKNGSFIYFAKGESIDGYAMNRIMEINGYCWQSMPATTLEKYERDLHKPFILKNGPTYLQKYYGGMEYASKRSYAKFELVIRAKDKTSDEEIYIPNQNVVITDFTVSSKTNICKALRLFIESDLGDKNYLINPTFDENGFDYAGAPLDLKDEKKYNTYTNFSISTTNPVEYPYGNFDELYYRDSPETVSGTIPPEQCGTFYSNHTKGTLAIDMERSKPWTIEYFGKSIFKEQHLVVAKSDESFKNYAFFNVYLYLEGWDKAADNVEAYKDFTFMMQFEVE